MIEILFNYFCMHVLCILKQIYTVIDCRLLLIEDTLRRVPIMQRILTNTQCLIERNKPLTYFINIANTDDHFNLKSSYIKLFVYI